jgi:hypothetical protein
MILSSFFFRISLRFCALGAMLTALLYGRTAVRPYRDIEPPMNADARSAARPQPNFGF